MRRLLVLMVLVLPMQLQAQADHADSLPLLRNLQVDARASTREKLPIMVFYMSEYCEYCEHVRELYLKPMLHNGELKGRAILRMVDIDGGDTMYGFDGEKIDQGVFANREGVSFTPVIKFYDSRGRELVPELLGYSSPEFYGAYLEQAIDQARERLK